MIDLTNHNVLNELKKSSENKTLEKRALKTRHWKGIKAAEDESFSPNLQNGAG